MKSLLNYILEVAKTTLLQTNNILIYKKISNLVNIEFLDVPDNEHDIRHIIDKYIHNLPEFRFNGISIYKYNNIIDEAMAAIEYLKKNGKIACVATDNHILFETINAVSGNFRSSEIYLEAEFIMISAKALFSLNNHYFIEYLYSHKNILHNSKVGQAKFNALKNKVNEVLKASNIDINMKYDFQFLMDLHIKFIGETSNLNCDLDLFKYDNNQLLTPLQYIQIIEEIVEKHYDFSLKMHNEFNIIKTNQLPWIDANISKIWIAGNISSINMEYKYLHLINPSDIVISFAAFEDSLPTFPHPLISKLNQVDYTCDIKTMQCRYIDPCPSIEKRGTSFAISHIAKLLNNPYSYYIEAILNIKQTKFHHNHLLGVIIHDMFEHLVKDNSKINNLQDMQQFIHEAIQNYDLSKREKLLIHNKIKIMVEHLHTLIQNASELYAEHEGVQEIVYNKKTYKLHGRADLIYKTKNNEYGVIDFKTGIPPSIVNVLNGKSPQISLEILMLKFGGFFNAKEINITDSGFISPKGLLKVARDDLLIESSIDGIQEVLKLFWDNTLPYYIQIKDIHYPQRLIARAWSTDAN